MASELEKAREGVRQMFVAYPRSRVEMAKLRLDRLIEAARAEGHRDGYTDGCNDTVAAAARAEGAKRGTCVTCRWKDFHVRATPGDRGVFRCNLHRFNIAEAGAKQVTAIVGCTAHEPREADDE